MKFFRKTLALICVIAMTSCFKESKTGGEGNDPFLGRWEVTDAQGAMAADHKGTTYIFRADSLAIVEKGIPVTAKYTRTLTEIKFDFNGFLIDYNYILQDQTMQWTNKAMTEEKLTLTKR